MAGQFKMRLKEGDDLDYIIDSGIYLNGGNKVLNCPAESTYFMVIVVNYDATNVFQLFLHNNGSASYRRKYATNWGEWRQISK